MPASLLRARVFWRVSPNDSGTEDYRFFKGAGGIKLRRNGTIAPLEGSAAALARDNTSS
jgi:hypothetical protein